MCVQDYLTWVAVKKNFEAKVTFDRVLAKIERNAKLGIIERDPEHVKTCDSQRAEVEALMQSMSDKLQRVVEQHKVMREDLYIEALFSDGSSPEIRSRSAREQMRVITIAKIQGIDLRTNLAKAIAIERVTTEACEDADELQRQFYGCSRSQPEK